MRQDPALTVMATLVKQYKCHLPASLLPGLPSGWDSRCAPTSERALLHNVCEVSGAHERCRNSELCGCWRQCCMLAGSCASPALDFAECLNQPAGQWWGSSFTRAACSADIASTLPCGGVFMFPPPFQPCQPAQCGPASGASGTPDSGRVASSSLTCMSRVACRCKPGMKFVVCRHAAIRTARCPPRLVMCGRCARAQADDCALSRGSAVTQ